MDSELESGEIFSVEYMRVRDVQKVLVDLACDRMRTFRFLDQHLSAGLTWARTRTAETYLMKLPPGEVEESKYGDFYVLHLRGNLFEVRAAHVVRWPLHLVDFPPEAERMRAEVKATFSNALTVYGRYGRGQDGKFNSTNVGRFEGAGWLLPTFAEDAP